MCGTLLEARRPAGATVPNPSPADTAKITPARIAGAQESPRSVVVGRAVERGAVDSSARPASTHVPPISGPSMLGLNETDANRTSLHSFLEPEQPKSKTGGLRILLLVVLLAALGGAGWWTYSYLDTSESRKSNAGNEAGNKSAA